MAALVVNEPSFRSRYLVPGEFSWRPDDVDVDVVVYRASVISGLAVGVCRSRTTEDIVTGGDAHIRRYVGRPVYISAQRRPQS